jgi:hypothetical protein
MWRDILPLLEWQDVALRSEISKHRGQGLRFTGSRVDVRDVFAASHHFLLALKVRAVGRIERVNLVVSRRRWDISVTGT